ncbi:MAG: regulatory protein RecX [Acidobacteria bacterium]|nr:regulatory protein RecX [Acidobacteriota bacterium]MBI3423885.1 regulatory protein RecX [Acidobacteriota bacterium]
MLRNRGKNQGNWGAKGERPTTPQATERPPTSPQTPYEKTLARAFRLLAAKARSVAQLRERLLEKAESEVVEQALARLVELGYLNDEEFARSFANSRLSYKPLGRTRLRQDLQRKQLAKPVVEQALETAYTEHSEEALIDRAIEKRLRLKGAPTTREEAKKLFDYLLRRGFSYDLVIRKVRAAGQSDITDEE